MGLDSVELVVAFEKRFNISIPDRESEQLSTINETAYCVCRHLQLPAIDSRSAIFSEVMTNVLVCLAQQKLQTESLRATTLLETIWPIGSALEGLQQLAQCLALEIPQVLKPRTGISAWLLGARTISEPLWPGTTLAQFVDWIMTLNHKQLLPEPNNIYDVRQVIIGITSDKIGLPVEEIKPTDRFTYDLGVE